MDKLIKLFIAFIVFLILFLILAPYKIIDVGERGVVLNFGAFNGKIMDSGLNWKTPIIESVVVYNVQTQKDEVQVTAASKDLQDVTATIAVNYQLDSKSVGSLHQKIGREYASRIISPAIQEAVKAATAKYTAEELITKRVEVKDIMKSVLIERLAKDFIIVEEVSIVNFAFSGSFNQAIEAKVTAEQNALASKNKLEQVKYEAQQAIEKAKAEAESIKIQASAINAQGGADYVKLQAIAKWNGVLPTQMLPNSTVPFIDISSK